MPRYTHPSNDPLLSTQAVLNSIKVVNAPMTAGALIEALEGEMKRVPVTVDDFRRRSCVMSAVQDWHDQRWDGVKLILAEARAIGRGACQGPPPSSLARAAGLCPHIAYDPRTKVVYGFGETFPDCQARVGWQLVELRRTNLMVHLVYQRAAPGFDQALAEYGADLPWTINLAGLAVPVVGYAQGGRPGPPSMDAGAVPVAFSRSR